MGETDERSTLFFDVSAPQGLQSLQAEMLRLQHSCNDSVGARTATGKKKSPRCGAKVVVIGADEPLSAQKRARTQRVENVLKDLSRLTGTITEDCANVLEARKQNKLLPMENLGAVEKGGNASNAASSKHCGNPCKSCSPLQPSEPMYVPVDPATGLMQYNYTRLPFEL